MRSDDNKFPCHIRCNGNCFMCIFAYRYRQCRCVKYLSAGLKLCVCVFIYIRLRSWGKISIGNCRCECGSCQRLNRVVECVCCAEIDCVVAKNNEAVEAEGLAEPPICITQHPGFHAVCLNHWVLQTAWYQYKQQYKDSYEGPSHKQNRHIAYRQLARWCWGLLGKEVRVVLPSCAVCCIRAHFPPPGLEEDFIFEGFHFPDE